MEGVLYTIVVFFATALGATTGAWGGAIIKPVFDLMGYDSAVIIGVYSTVAVFSMCLSSIYKHSKSGLKFNWSILIALSAGSMLGGIIGELIFRLATQQMENQTVTSIQSIFFFCVLLCVFFFTRFHEKFPKYKVENPLMIVCLGFLVGSLSIFLVIGGGPLNVIVLMGMMSFTTKEPTAYSIAMIFFAQIPKIFTIVFATPMGTFKVGMVPIIALTAVVGGYLGTRINHFLSEKQVTLMYSLMMIALLMTCVVNIISNLCA